MKNILKVLVLSLLVSASLNAAAEKNDKNATEAKANSVTCTISGQVVDQATGEALVGVAVKVAGTDKVAYTDFDGKFAIGGLSQGQYSLESNFISYEKASVNQFDLSAGETKSVEINLSKSN